MIKYLVTILFVLSLFVCFFPLTVQADVTIDNPLQWNSFWELINKIIDFIFYLSLGIAPIMIIVAGFYFITAAGDPAKIEIAKKIILWTLIGLLVIMSAKGLIALFGQIFGVQTPYS